MPAADEMAALAGVGVALEDDESGGGASVAEASGPGEARGEATKGSSEPPDKVDEPVGNGRRKDGLRTFRECDLDAEDASDRPLASGGLDGAWLPAAAGTAEVPVRPGGSLLASLSRASANRCEKGANAAAAADWTEADIDVAGGLPPPFEVGGVPAEKYELPGLAARSPLCEPESGENERIPRTGDRLAFAYAACES